MSEQPMYNLTIPETERPEIDYVPMLLIKMLREEVKALRSVLSEWEADKSCYLQMIRADDINRAIAVIEEHI